MMDWSVAYLLLGMAVSVIVVSDVTECREVHIVDIVMGAACGLLWPLTVIAMAAGRLYR